MADIVTVPSGDFTPGALAALTYPAEMINAAWNQANSKATDVSTKVTAAETFIDGAPVTDVTADVATTPTVVEPAVTIPSTLSAGDVMTLFDTKYAELVTLLAGKFTDFIAAYFPNENALYGKAEAWLSSTFDNPLSGLPAGVADQLLEDERTRILNDASRASDAVLATFAARRFPLPPGAATAATLQIQQKAQEEIAASGRKITILSIDLFKFAVEKTLNLRQLAMNSAVDYVKALVSAPEIASRLVGVGYDAQSKLISSAASYFNARTEAARLLAQADQFNVTSKLTADEKNQMVQLSLVEDRLKLLMAELQTIGQMATSLYNNLHASAGTTYGISVSSSE
jgi:hypothetical protein